MIDINAVNSSLFIILKKIQKYDSVKLKECQEIAILIRIDYTPCTLVVINHKAAIIMHVFHDIFHPQGKFIMHLKDFWVGKSRIC